MDFRSIWNRHIKKIKPRTVQSTDAITNHHKCHPLLSQHAVRGFSRLLLPSDGCSGILLLQLNHSYLPPVSQELTRNNFSHQLLEVRDVTLNKVPVKTWHQVITSEAPNRILLCFLPTHLVAWWTAHLKLRFPKKQKSREQAATTHHGNFGGKYTSIPNFNDSKSVEGAEL